VDPDNLPEWLGGRSKGTLLDDVGPWSDPDTLHKIEGSLPEAARALKRMSHGSSAGGTAAMVQLPASSSMEGPPLVMVDSEVAADGFHSPRCGVVVAGRRGAGRARGGGATEGRTRCAAQ
jgi:hypothetical protein